MSVHVSLIVHPNVYACERKKVNAIALALTFLQVTYHWYEELWFISVSVTSFIDSLEYGCVVILNMWPNISCSGNLWVKQEDKTK